MTPERRSGWRDVLIGVLVALLVGVVSGAQLGVSEQRVRDVAREETASLRETVTELKGSIAKLTDAMNALTLQLTVLQAKDSR